MPKRKRVNLNEDLVALLTKLTDKLVQHEERITALEYEVADLGKRFENLAFSTDECFALVQDQVTEFEAKVNEVKDLDKHLGALSEEVCALGKAVRL